MPDHGGSVFALIASPYQALCLVEYVEKAGITSGAVVIPRQREPEMMTPVFETLAHLRNFTFHFRVRSGFGQPGEGTGPIAEDVAELARTVAPDASIVIGDYRDTLGWKVARLLDRTKDVVVLDDGVGTLAIDRGDGGFEPVVWSEQAERDGYMPLPEATFFTAYGGQFRTAPGDRVIDNDWQWLTARYRELPVSESLTLVIGQGFERVDMVDVETATEFARRLVARARELHPGGQPLYVAHRGDSMEKLKAVAEDCPVVRFDIPLELVPVEGGALPAAVVGHCSTAMISFASLAPGAFPITAVRLPFDRLKIRSEHVVAVYRRMEQPGSGITVVD